MNRLLIFLFFLSISIAKGQNSVLASGYWIKVGVNKEGIFKIDQSFLSKYSVNSKNLNPQNIRVFIGHPTALPQKNSDFRTQDLKELSIHLIDSDNKFDKNDQILFYIPSPHKIKLDTVSNLYSHEINPYSDSSFVFINLNGPISKKITNQEIVSASSKAKTSLPYYDYFEKEIKNVFASGRRWLGEFFFNNLSFNVELSDVDETQKAIFNTSVLGIGRSAQSLDFQLDKISKTKILMAGSLYAASDAFARYNRYSNFSDLNFTLDNPKEKFNVEFKLATENSANAGAYLDYYSINYSKKLIYDPKALRIFRLRGTLKEPKISLALSNSDQNTLLWSIDDKLIVKNILFRANEPFDLKLEKGENQILLFNKSLAEYPVFHGIIKNQDIRKNVVPELLIVFPDKFRQEVERLIIHKKQMNLEVLGLSTSEIYNEFSSGKRDPSAIRDVCRYFWTKEPQKFKFLLLFGDATFDYKNNNKISFLDQQLLVPTYESIESLEPIYSFSSDDYFGFLEPQEGEWEEGYSKDNVWISNNANDHSLDIAVGRLPVKTIFEARNMINKLISYEKPFITDGSWKDKIVFVADNRDYNIHQRDAENLSENALKNWAGFDISKIYLDDFPINGIGQAVSAPLATSALTNAILNGAFLINYNGHGSEDGWAQEKLLTNKEIVQWKNTSKLPIFFTATCQFGKFDNPNIVSGAELALLSPNGGAIALLTTTRPVYSSTNEKINSAFYKNISSSRTLGDLFKITKNQSIQGEINRNFSLLGDPSLVFPIFGNSIKLLSLDGRAAEGAELKAQSKVKIKGEVPTIKNGQIRLQLFDKILKEKTLGSFIDSPILEFNKLDNKLFESILDIKSGVFEGNIIIPSEILKGIGEGKILFYAIDSETNAEQFGFFNNFKLNGDLLGPKTDNDPPQINSSLDKAMNLNFDFFDESGFNISELDRNHQLSLSIDDSLVIDIKRYFNLSSGYKEAKLAYFVGNLSNGKHKAKIIVFDNYNNKAEKSFDFNIEKQTFEVKSFINYPNPFFNYTNLVFTHNRKGDNLEAILKVFDLSGKLIGEYAQQCFECDSKIEFGLDFASKNVFNNQLFFKIVIKSLSENVQTFSSGRMLFWK